MKKKLVVLPGVTGAIGSALLAEYGQDANTVIYGISRKGLPLEEFLDADHKLPTQTLICSLEFPHGYELLFKSINYEEFTEVMYIHALGYYSFEITKQGKIAIKNDSDGDGINDRVMALTYDYFKTALDALRTNWSGKATAIVFGGIADKHRPAAHTSWWKTIEKTKTYMREKVLGDTKLEMLLVNISSVLCPHEVITRPFVFTQTDADQTYWLHPVELARFVIEQTKKSVPGFREIEKFRIKPGFKEDTYYTDDKFTPRKVTELFE